MTEQPVDEFLDGNVQSGGWSIACSLEPMRYHDDRDVFSMLQGCKSTFFASGSGMKVLLEVIRNAARGWSEGRKQREVEKK